MQHNIRPAKAPIHASISIPGSSSITNRALMLAALADGVSEISGIRIDEDTKTFVNALRQVGIVTQLDEKSCSCIIAGGNGKVPKKQTTIWCADAEDAAHYLMTVCAASPGVHYFDTSPDLRERSFAGLLSILSRQGMQLIPNDTVCMPFTIIGADSFLGGDIILDSSVTSTLVSALLLIAPYARATFNFNFNEVSGQEHINMTCAMMAEFGVLTHRLHQGQFMVPVPQRYQARDYIVEPDFALASYFFAAAAVTSGEITIQPVQRSLSKQMDVKCLSVLEKMGCSILETHAGLTLKGPAVLKGIEVSMREFSDIFLMLAAIAPFADSPTRITHIDKISPAETALINTVKKELEKMHIRVEAGEDWIKIFPGTPRGAVIHPHEDSRIAMAFSLIGLKVPGVVIENTQCIMQVFPEFFTFWDELAEHAHIGV